MEMGFRFWVLGFCFWVCFFFSCSGSVNSNGEEGDGFLSGTVSIDGKSAIGGIDEDFICATLDWWPPEKCDYGTCSWGQASLLNLDLGSNILLNAIKEFKPLKLRLGGTLQDKLIYDTEDHKQPCISFKRDTKELFGFTQGCLPLDRWDKLNDFFKKGGAKIIFGLNALNGRKFASNGSAVGAWNYMNAESFVRYTVKKNYIIHGWEFGNELCGSGVGTRISAEQYASDTIVFQKMVQSIYNGVQTKPLTIAPGGFFDENWFKEFVDKTTPTLDAVTHHIYNLGAGVDKHLVERILNPSYLNGMVETFYKLHEVLRNSRSSAKAWVGEAGGAYSSGHNLVSNAFVSSFWYLDQLGMAATFDTKTYCRQTLIGGNYGLLNTTTFEPNPDYYSALLWHRLMGRNVLSTRFNGTKKIRAYAHCSKQSKGITLLLLNLDGNTTVHTELAFNRTSGLHYKHRSYKNKQKVVRTSRPYGREGEAFREEYHITAKDGNLHSQTVLLNGKILSVNSSGNIPSLQPKQVNSSEPITVAPFSIVFVHIPNIVLPACSNVWN
ncbi:heparanase-like protein 3 [Cucurbita moschata]|uniref:Heparanase-like protein 3 n=1 Tax=Cucurbita moschata TaxID=3662 RepID=A0A6J1G2Y8_CUCMO|nr:heparanase-like protein 3 [Cucurbita moschata]